MKRSLRQVLRDGDHEHVARALTMSHMALNTTTRCQQRCVYCFEGDRTDRTDLPPDEVRAHLRATAERCAGVVFMGAEPTLNPDLLELIADAKRLGLNVQVSTNALRFKSPQFLERCIAAGLDSLEMSFPYPDEDVYTMITGVPPAGYRSLLVALDNIRTASRIQRSRDPSHPFGVAINIVVSQFNYRRLADVISGIRQYLGDPVWLLTMKAIGPSGRETATLTKFVRDYFVPLQLAREAFVDLVSAWNYEVPIVFRGFPLCALPGFEDLAANLYYHAAPEGSATVLENIHLQQRVAPMNAWKTEHEPLHVRAECGRCSLAPICLDRFMLAFDPEEPLNRPIPSTRSAEDVLEEAGFAPEVRARLLSPP